MHTQHTPTRRSLLRAAAWSAPVVTVATAAPAYATSTTPGTPLHTFSSLTWGLGDWNVIAVPTRLEVSGLRVRTASDAATIPARGLTVTVTFPRRYVRAAGTDVDVLVTDVSSGWVAAAPQYGGSGDLRYATVTFTHVGEVRPGLLAGTTSLNFRARRDTVIQPSTYDAPLPVAVNAPGFRSSAGFIVVT